MSFFNSENLKSRSKSGESLSKLPKGSFTSAESKVKMDNNLSNNELTRSDLSRGELENTNIKEKNVKQYSDNLRDKGRETSLVGKTAKSYLAAGNLEFSRNQIACMFQDKYFSNDEFAQKGIVEPKMKDKVLLDEYRNLRTKLIASTRQSNFITLVTSVFPDGGSSIVATNLAATFALDHSKTSLLIDANINNPSLSNILGVNAEIGLINYLDSEEIVCEDVLFSTPIPRLRLLPSGNSIFSPTEYFTSHRMKKLMNDLVSRYPERFPIIDAPNITDSVDTRILIELCDKVILVVPYGKCSIEEIKYAVSAIGEEKFAGIVLNGFSAT